MGTDKILENFNSVKNSVYFKTFDKVTEEKKVSEKDIIEKLKKVFDPEIPVNIYDLGLIYSLDIDKEKNIIIRMTLTTPNCPVADSMPESVGKAVSEIEGISSIKVVLVWEPKWSKDMMSEDAKLALDVF